MDKLKSFIQSRVSLADSEMQLVLSRFREHRLKKGALLLRKGQVATDYYFIASGALRIILNTGDREITGWIALENEFFTELSSAKKQTPSRFSISAIENTTVFLISVKEMEALYGHIPEWQRFGREIWEDAFTKVVDGILNYQALSAEERYRMTMENSDLLQRLPLKDLSSYLGITPTSLSRIRKNIK